MEAPPKSNGERDILHPHQMWTRDTESAAGWKTATL